MISIIDILLVAIIIYEFLALIKGTRASLMVVGVAGLGLVFYLSRLGNLAALNWLISTLLPYTVFALIVVFAAEIRQALARLGRGLTLSRTTGSEADAYDDIVLAANLFCQNQTGSSDRHRTRDWFAYLHRERSSARRAALLRSAGNNLPAERSSARRRRDRAE